MGYIVYGRGTAGLDEIDFYMCRIFQKVLKRTKKERIVSNFRNKQGISTYYKWVYLNIGLLRKRLMFFLKFISMNQ